jgi:transcriptional regulator with XRE-family HTH domain
VRREDPDEILRAVGRRIADLRRAAGWTQQDFAARLGVSVRYLARLEAGGQNLTVHRLAWLAQAFELRVVDLLLPAGPERKRGERAGQRG